MFPRSRRSLFIFFSVVLLLVLIYWIIPSPGQILLVPSDWSKTTAWPRVQLDDEQLRPGETATVWIYDTTPWPHVNLFVNGAPTTPHGYQYNEASGIYQWRWTFTVPETPPYHLAFYHSCQTGCREWTAVSAGDPLPLATTSPKVPTKLGVVFANPDRDWHNRAGWTVELTYAQIAEEDYWGIDDLAARVQAASQKGLFVLVRVDYAPGQSIPPPDDQLALNSYLAYLRRLAGDARLQPVYGYVIGSSFNTAGNNTLSPEKMVTPEWYGRVFNGYGLPPNRRDNALQAIHDVNPNARVLVGPVAPWRTDQNGATTYQIDVPWLNYFNTLVSVLDQAAQAKSAIGLPFATPDGFALQAFGRPDLLQMATRDAADEPHRDLHQSEWGEAQMGFRVYRDWLNIINSYPTTAGLPAFITAANTYNFATEAPPAQNYPAGWLTNALEAINQEPQILALCWFIDHFPHDDQWYFFSLSEPRGRTIDAAEELDTLLQTAP